MIEIILWIGAAAFGGALGAIAVHIADVVSGSKQRGSKNA